MLRMLTILALVLSIAPAAAQRPARTLLRAYLSQGEWSGVNGVKLTDSGRALIAEAAEKTVAGTTMQIDINGMADLASSPEAQVRIADARVEAVRTEFLRVGVPASDPCRAES